MLKTEKLSFDSRKPTPLRKRLLDAFAKHGVDIMNFAHAVVLTKEQADDFNLDAQAATDGARDGLLSQVPRRYDDPAERP